MLTSLNWTKPSRSSSSFVLSLSFEHMWLKSPGWISVRPCSSITHYKSSLAWFLLLKNLWKTKYDVWVNAAGIAAEGSSACRRGGGLHLFDVLFFLLLLLRKPNQPDLSVSRFFGTWRNRGELNITFQPEFCLNTLWGKFNLFKIPCYCYFFYNFHSAIKVSIVCETDPSLYELVI